MGSCRNPASVENKWESQIVETRKLLSGEMRCEGKEGGGAQIPAHGYQISIWVWTFLPEPSHMGAVCVVKFLHVTHPFRGIASLCEHEVYAKKQ